LVVLVDRKLTVWIDELVGDFGEEVVELLEEPELPQLGLELLLIGSTQEQHVFDLGVLVFAIAEYQLHVIAESHHTLFEIFIPLVVSLQIPHDLLLTHGGFDHLLLLDFRHIVEVCSLLPRPLIQEVTHIVCGQCCRARGVDQVFNHFYSKMDPCLII